jgi:tetratricopeptide (TPR) repeat protein
MNMRWRRSVSAIGLLTAMLASSAVGQQDEKLGKVTFQTSCDPKVQAEFNRGVAMLHSYWFLIARRTFEGILQQDPTCAIAYWGVAMDYLGNTLATVPTRAEVQAYYALTLQASAKKSDLTYANQIKSAGILEKLFEQNPQHPGVTHYLIHAYDFAPLADKGVASARRYAGIAPAVPHARHMPSHIYSMVGLWQESIASNQSAIEIQPDYFHAADFAVYAHLQLGQDVKAKALAEKSIATADRGDRPINFVNFTAKAAMPARYVLDRGDWAGAAALELKPSQYPMADSLTRFTRGLGMARSGNLVGAKSEVEAMKVLRAALERVNDSYWADRTEEQMLAVSAWVALKEGSRDQAMKFMRAAAENEDNSVKHVAMENRLYPMHELYGDLLLEAGDAPAALVAYETALKATPNRYRGILGVARAADATGNRAKAVEYYGKLIELAKNGDVERQEVRDAKVFLAKK